jgi:hypothetical protein
MLNTSGANAAGATGANDCGGAQWVLPRASPQSPRLKRRVKRRAKGSDLCFKNLRLQFAMQDIFVFFNQFIERWIYFFLLLRPAVP